VTLVTLPYRTELSAGQAEDIGMVLADLDAILAVVNGDLRNDNFAAGAALSLTKMAITGTPDGTKFLRDDSSWQPVVGSEWKLIGDSLLAAASPALRISVRRRWWLIRELWATALPLASGQHSFFRCLTTQEPTTRSWRCLLASSGASPRTTSGLCSPPVTGARMLQSTA
jgi:hypothetical protein